MESDTSPKPRPGLALMFVGVALVFFGVLGVITGEFDYELISIHELDPASARVAAACCALMGVGTFALGLGQRRQTAWLIKAGTWVAVFGFASMWVGPILHWIS